MLVAYAELENRQPLRLRVRKRIEEHGVNHCENGRVCANAQRERQHGDGREPRRLAQHLQAESRIAPRRFDPESSLLFSTFLFVFLAPAELNTRATRGFVSWETAAFEIVCTILDVRPKFLFHLAFQVRAMKEFGRKRPNRSPEFHISSGWVPRAAPMAATRRFQLSASSRNRFRPAAVSS